MSTRTDRQAVLSASARTNGRTALHAAAVAIVFACAAGHIPFSSAAAGDAAQVYPTRPIRILVGFSAGSTSDILARAVAQKLSEGWGQPVVVDNRPSAGGVLASQTVAAATPDGHTLISVSAGHAVSAALYKNLPYDTERDFAGIALLATVPSILVVSASAGVKSVKDLVQLARSKPGAYNYSSPGIGSANHLGAELLKSLARLDVAYVPFKGIPEALTAAMTGTSSSTSRPY